MSWAQEAEACRVDGTSGVRANPRQADERRRPRPHYGEWIAVGVADESHPVDVGQRRVIRQRDRDRLRQTSRRGRAIREDHMPRVPPRAPSLHFGQETPVDRYRRPPASHTRSQRHTDSPSPLPGFYVRVQSFQNHIITVPAVLKPIDVSAIVRWWSAFARDRFAFPPAAPAPDESGVRAEHRERVEVSSRSSRRLVARIPQVPNTGDRVHGEQHSDACRHGLVRTPHPTRRVLILE